MPEQRADTVALPLFSLCLYLHNQRHLLEDCLLSILEQTYPTLELVVFDDGSCDFDEAEVRTYITGEAGKKLQNLVVFHHPTYLGLAAACNQAVALSSGRIFGCLSPEASLTASWVLDRIAKRFISPHVQVVCARVQVDGLKDVDEKEDETVFPRWNAFQEIAGAGATGQFSMLALEPWGTYAMDNAVFWRRSCYDALGGFDAAYPSIREWPLLLRACDAGATLTYLDVPFVRITHKPIDAKLFSPDTSLMSAVQLRDSLRVLDGIGAPVFHTGGFFSGLRFQMTRRQMELLRIAKEEWFIYGQGARLRVHLDPYVLLIRLRKTLQTNTYTKLQGAVMVFLILLVAAFWCATIQQVFPGTWFWSFLALASGTMVLLKVLYNMALFLLRRIVRQLRV